TQNGAIEHTIDSGAGQFELRVRAKGDRLSGISPQMNVYVDGVLLGGKRPDTVWANHAFPIALEAGSHTVKIAFTNDYANSTGDRDLHLDRVELVYVGP
ncbi:MAG TPA: carbohydrate-binding domain-containing protein, partial [Candidatus Thermoplasmatota archaeon]